VISAHITNNDAYCLIYIDGDIDVFAKANKRNPMIPTSDELKMGIIMYLQVNNKQALDRTSFKI
jgi:hypothetical protein